MALVPGEPPGVCMISAPPAMLQGSATVWLKKRNRSVTRNDGMLVHPSRLAHSAVRSRMATAMLFPAPSVTSCRTGDPGGSVPLVGTRPV